MSWHPVTYWAVRCDGLVRHGRQCERLFTRQLDDDPAVGEPHPAEWAWESDPPTIRNVGRKPFPHQPEPVPAELMDLLTERRLPEWLRVSMRFAGWLVDERNGRVLCPDHVAAQEKWVAAQLDGLPFDEGIEIGNHR